MAEEGLPLKRRISSLGNEYQNVKIAKISDGKADSNPLEAILQDSSSFHKPSEPPLSVDWLKFPDEIWTAIFQWIPTKDKLKLRLVSKAWKKNVDLLSSFKAQVDGRMGLEKLEQIRVKRIQSMELLSLQDEKFEPRFKFPNYVKELIVTTLVSPANFVKCCEVFSEVQSLRFISTVKSDTTFDPQNKESSRKALGCLKKLKEIDIMIHSFAPRAVWSSETFNIIFDETPLAFGNLSTVSINMVLHHGEMEVFFKCLLLRSKTLKSVTARICCASPSRSVVEKEMCFSDQPWFSELKNLSFQSLHIFHSQMCGSCDLDVVWNEILRKQTSLLRVTADFNDMTVSDVFEILRKNKKIQSCKIYRVICAYLFEVDGLEALNEVSDSIQELALDFVNSAVISCNPASALQLEMRFFDFLNLPISLRKLAIRGYSLSKDQFLTTLRGLKHVEEFNVGNCVFRDSATSISLFKEILHTLGSENCSVRRFIFDGFENQELGEDGKKWRSLEDAAQRFGILHHQLNCDEMDCGNSFYDFRFTKSEMREFAAIAERLTVDRGSHSSIEDAFHFSSDAAAL